MLNIQSYVGKPNVFAKCTNCKLSTVNNWLINVFTHILLLMFPIHNQFIIRLVHVDAVQVSGDVTVIATANVLQPAHQPHDTTPRKFRVAIGLWCRDGSGGGRW